MRSSVSDTKLLKENANGIDSGPMVCLTSITLCFYSKLPACLSFEWAVYY